MIFFLRFHEERVENTPYQASPVHHTVHDGLLLGAGPPQIDPGGLNALMSHKVRQQGQVIEPFQKAFGKPVAPFSVVVLGKFRRFLLVIFLSLFLHLDFSFIYSKFSMPFWGFFY